MNFTYLSNLLSNFYIFLQNFFNSDYIVFVSVFFLIIGLIRVVLRWSM